MRCAHCTRSDIQTNTAALCVNDRGVYCRNKMAVPTASSQELHEWKYGIHSTIIIANLMDCILPENLAPWRGTRCYFFFFALLLSCQTHASFPPIYSTAPRLCEWMFCADCTVLLDGKWTKIVLWCSLDVESSPLLLFFFLTCEIWSRNMIKVLFQSGSVVWTEKISLMRLAVS